MSKEMYVQCSVMKIDGGSTLQRTFWTNADKAEVGRAVKIEEDDGSWSEGWEVSAVYGPPLPKTYVQYMSHAHTRQRKASDI
jgi:hypothetical protein